MEVMDHAQRGFKAVMVSLTTNEVLIYRDKYMVGSMKTEDVVTGMKFGRFGREDSTLVMTTKGVYILEN